MLINDLYACDIYIKTTDRIQLIDIIKKIMSLGSSVSAQTIISENFGEKLDLLSYIKYYNIETKDYILSKDIKDKINKIKVLGKVENLSILLPK
jgi:hypothetical protein